MQSLRWRDGIVMSRRVQGVVFASSMVMRMEIRVFLAFLKNKRLPYFKKILASSNLKKSELPMYQLNFYQFAPYWKTFWEEKFTGKEILFLSVNMKDCGCRKVRKHKQIRGSDKCVTLDISEKFDILNKMETTSSESKENWKDQERGW